MLDNINITRLNKEKDILKTLRTLEINLTGLTDKVVGKVCVERLLLEATLAGSFIGGLYGTIHSGYFFIYLLWIDKAYRNCGLASKLIAEAELYAKKKNVLYVRVDSASFQAPSFYLGNNYLVLAELPLIINNKEYTNYYFIKYLV